MRREGDPPDAEAVHVIIFLTLGAPERRRLAKKKRAAPPDPDPAPVTTCRVTIVDVGDPFESTAGAAAWLKEVKDEDLDPGLLVLNRTLQVFRLVTADPGVTPAGRHGALVARLGYGAGEQVSDGQWTDAVEIVERRGRQSRAKVLTPQARLAAVLGGRERWLVCEELILRARLDIDNNRAREAALQVLVALDAAIAEISIDPTGPRLQKRLADLGERREGIADAAQAALGGPLDDEQLELVTATLVRLESILRARAVVNAQ